MRRGNITAGFIGGALGATGMLSAVALADKKLREGFFHRIDDIRAQGEHFIAKVTPRVTRELNGKRRIATKSIRTLRTRSH